MKFLFLTDTHFRTKSPVNRTDNILESLFEKFEWTLQYAAEIGAKIIHGGDLFHSPNVPDFVATRIVRLFKKYESEVYFVIGNHDVTGANCDTYDYSKIGLLAEYPWFHLLGKKPVKFKDCILFGYDFSKAMECPQIIDPYKDFNINPENKIPSICIVHSMITDDMSVAIEGKMKTINWNMINSTATVVLSGHYHPGWDGVRTTTFGTQFINPGAIIRQEGSEIDINRKPKIVILKVKDGDIKINFSVVPHKKDVFNLDNIAGKKSSEEEKNRFIDALSNLKDEDIMGTNVLNIIERLNSNKPKDLDDILTDKVFQMCQKKVKEVIDNG